VNQNRRTLQEICELASKEYDGNRLSDFLEEILELLAEEQAAKTKKTDSSPQ
jgi:hypothetical protein